VDLAFRAAAEAAPGWAGATPSERQRGLLKLADLIEARGNDLVIAESQNTGKPLELTRTEELAVLIDQLRFFAGAARMLEGKSAGEYLAGHTSYVRREPIGVVGQITPWNYPMMMAIWKFAPAIAAGNTVVLKPAETTPVTTVMLAELAAEVLPPGVLNVVCGDRETGQSLVEHPTPQLVSITGSTRAGTQVASTAALDLKRTHLELGGKAPAIVFEDADLAAAAEAIGVGGYFNAGQDCTAACRVLVHESKHDAFVEALAGWARDNAKPGLADDEDALFGPLNNAMQLERVRGFLARKPAHASVVLGGERSGRALADGFFHDATIVTGLRQDDEMIQDEVFGPVITIQPFADEAEGLRMANGVQYGLASSVFTTDHSRALRMSAALDFGCVWINTHIPLVAEMPHGGFKHSGHGKDLSMYGLEDYTRVKHVMSAI
jgi:betaine-aldehyde dehydrogenase